VRIRAIRASTGDCRVDDALGAFCEFTDLAADTGTSVTVTLEALSACKQAVAVSVSTPGDVLPANDSVSARIDVLGPTDLELRVDTAASAAAGATFEFPAISVVNGNSAAVGTRLEVALPAGMSLVSLSAADAICSGTSVLRCDFADLEANRSVTVNISVRASGHGSFTSTLKLTSINDTNPANDSRQVALDITRDQAAPAPAAAGSGGGGGGGGRLEWLLLGLFAALVWRRCRAGTC
jgi:hypothetical protein